MLKNVMILFVLMMLSAGCNRAQDCYNSVQDVFPNDFVYPIPGKQFSFIVEAEDVVYYIETLNWFTNSISFKYIIPLTKYSKHKDDIGGL